MKLSIAFVERHAEVVSLIFKCKPVCSHHFVGLGLENTHECGLIQADFFVLSQFFGHLLHFPLNRAYRLLCESVLSQIKVGISAIHFLVRIT